METRPVLNALARRWWVLLVRGILAVLFGIVAFALPGLTIVTLVLLFGIYALTDGLTAIWVGAGWRSWSLMLVGVLGVLAGICAFVLPGMTAVLLLYVIAVWAIVRGVFEIVAAITFREAMRNEWTLVIAGIFSIIFGVLLISRPMAGALAMIWLIGLYAVLFGAAMMVLALRVRRLPGRL